MAKSSLTRITVKDATADDGIRLKNLLIQDGLVQGQDFEWAWERVQDSVDFYLAVRAAHFDFADAALATFYQLKWA
jgi:hypothetical protein